LRSPALISAHPSAVCHAVLALLSEGYPPLEGRSPTRYSPVCHANNPLRGLRVRLACIRHAASVDSEPGSNSQVKFGAPRVVPCGTPRGANRFNPRRLLNWLSRIYHPAAETAGIVKFGQFIGLRDLATASAQCCPLILDGLCLHVLSSFQRTGFLLGHQRELRSLGNLTNLRQLQAAVNAFFGLL
jgi:hypothetical protein